MAAHRSAKLIDPPTLKFSFVATDTPETYRDVFKDFTASIQADRPPGGVCGFIYR